jgi:uncharacterized protein YecE (DUF72 family)
MRCPLPRWGMSLYVGTSGYSYPEWRGPFYPDGLAEKQMLRYYGGQFATVEINNTFHRMPTVPLLEGWRDQVPLEFRFFLKAPQRITHLQRLKDVDDSVSLLMDVAAVLGERLGGVLFQLPPGLKRDLPRLRDFLALLPPQRRVALEFRDDSWFDDEVFALLRRHDVALCIAEREEGVEVPFVATAKWGYLRLRRPDYSVAELKDRVRRIRDQHWRDVFVFFKHEESAKGPLLAKRFLELAG